MREEGEMLRIVRMSTSLLCMEGHTGSMPVDRSSSGKLRTCSVICTSDRGMLRVRMMLRSVL